MSSRLASPFWKTVMMGSAFTGGLYIVIRWQKNNNQKKYNIEIPDTTPSENERMATFDQISDIYDSVLQFDEWFLRMGKYRKRLINQAEGRVLEVAAGTGRNLKYYVNDKIEEVYFVDKSPNMMDQLKHKPIARKKMFKVFSVNDSENLRFPDNVFDCVIDTFGICSYENPENAINEMIRVCKPGKKILLLEHGISNWSLVKSWQNRKMLQHVYSWGCYYNRDISSYFENRNDIDIKIMERRHFGTTYYIEAIKKDPQSMTITQSNNDQSVIDSTNELMNQSQSTNGQPSMQM